MNIAFISPGTLPVPPVEGGAVENLMDILLKKNETLLDHQITVFSSYTKEAFKKTKQYKNSNFKFIHKKSVFFKAKQGIYFIKKKLSTNTIGNAFIDEVILKIRSQSFDMLIVENQPGFAKSIRDNYDGKLVLHLHNDYVSNKLLTKEICEHYDAIITVSNFLKNKVESLRSNTPVFLVYNGLTFDTLLNVEEQKKQILLDKLGVENNEIVVLYTGRLLSSKGVHLLVEAFKKLTPVKQVKLIITGSSTFKNSTKNKYIDYLEEISKDDKRIIFTGYIDYDEIGTLYSIADIGVVPSINEEAFGLTALEHMIAGHPVIITNAGGLPEVVDDKSAITIDVNTSDIIGGFYESLNLLCSNKGLRESMGREALIRASMFKDSHYYDSFVKVIHQVGDNK